MQYKFSWATNISNENKSLVEMALEETVESVHSPINFCHSEEITVNLSLIGIFNDEFIGNFKCSCGKQPGIAKGKIDGSSITLEAIQC